MPSIVYILVILIGQAAGMVFVAGEINGEIVSMLGKERADAIQKIIEKTSTFDPNPVIKGAGVMMLIFTSTGIFIAIQDGLNTVWNVRATGGGEFLKMIKDRALSFLMTLSAGAIFVFLMVLQGFIELFSDYIKETGILFIVILNNIISGIIYAFLFALIYKVMPRIILPWKSLWGAAIAAALLFMLGKFLLVKYLAASTYNSTYAAGAVIIILSWIFYSSYILFVTAKFTQVYIRKTGYPLILRPSTVKTETTVLKGT